MRDRHQNSINPREDGILFLQLHYGVCQVLQSHIFVKLPYLFENTLA